MRETDSYKWEKIVYRKEQQLQTRLDVEIQKQLKRFRLDVKLRTDGGCVGILGPSGCGKSMTLKSIAGIVTPDEGLISIQKGTEQRILFDKSQKVNIKPQKRRIGYLFQNYALFPNMTVQENIAAGLAGDVKNPKVGEMIGRFGLSGLEKQYPGQLSGGQQQRTALARILAYEPDALLLDEPFSAMDAYLKERLRLELKKTLSEYEGVSVMVTHDRDEAFQLCDHLLLMEEGRVIAAGETKAVFADPGTWQAARLTGCKNLSRIEKTGSRRVRALDWDGLELVTAQDVGDEIKAVGIRAHDFEPLSSGEALEWGKREDANLIPVEGAEISEMPFEWYVTMKNHLWWKIEKTIHVHESAGLVPEYLRISPEAIVLLRTDH